jgi:hypothetical protein
MPGRASAIRTIQTIQQFLEVEIRLAGAPSDPLLSITDKWVTFFPRSQQGRVCTLAGIRTIPTARIVLKQADMTLVAEVLHAAARLVGLPTVRVNIAPGETDCPYKVGDKAKRIGLINLAIADLEAREEARSASGPISATS